MIHAVLQFIHDDERINESQLSQFSSVTKDDEYGNLFRKDSSGKAGRYRSVADVQSGMVHKLTDFKLVFKYD